MCKELRQLSKLCWKGICEREFEVGGNKTATKGQFQAQCNREIDWKEYYFLRKQLFRQGSMEWVQPNVQNRPSARMAHTGVAVGRKIVYIGGQLEDLVRYDDIYFLDVDTLVFSKPSIKGNPPKFARHVGIIGKSSLSYGFQLQLLEPKYMSLVGLMDLASTMVLQY